MDEQSYEYAIELQYTLIYGDNTNSTAHSAVGAGHTVSVHADLDLKRFGIVQVEMIEAYRYNTWSFEPYFFSPQVEER